MKTTYSIGEFSKVTGLSVKTLRFYHEKGILVPSSVDDASGYRFYDESKIEKARVMVQLRAMEFSIEDIGAVLGECADEADVLNYLERQKEVLQQRIQEDRDIVRSLSQIIAQEREARQILEQSSFAVEERTLDEVLIAAVRMKGKYSDCGTGFARLGKAVGRYICGKPLCLYYDCEYREDDADYETCFPIRKEVSVPGISVRRLPGGRCLALVHKGPYPALGRSYARILARVRENGLNVSLPTREVYLKGPGIIFRGNPKKYLTEIQLPVGS